MTSGFLVTIPVPPSVNAIYGNNKHGKGRGRFKTKRYKEWLTAAGWQIKEQKPQKVSGKYRFFLAVPKTRCDTDNFIKPTQDLIVSLGLVDDDRYCVDCRACVNEDLIGYATVSIEPIEG